MTDSLGPSNDDSNAVRVEIRAAELERASDGALDGRCPGTATTAERWGWEDHQADEVDGVESEIPGWNAGFLAREIATHDQHDRRDAEAFAWDISRPLAEQFAETARADVAADAMCQLGNEGSTGTSCLCGHAVEEHGNDPEFPGSTACDECDGECIAFESWEGAP